MTRDYLLGPKPFTLPLHVIIAEVAQKHGVSYDELISDRRQKRMIAPRFEAYWRCARETPASYPQIGRAFGNRDHTTILHGVRRHEKRLAEAANGAP